MVFTTIKMYQASLQETALVKEILRNTISLLGSGVASADIHRLCVYGWRSTTILSVIILITSRST